MTDLEHALGTSDQCTENETNKDSGAGANAGTKADMVFVSTSPISELVWSPHNGLGLKYANSSLTEKASLLWSTESFNIIIAPPQCTNGGESSNNRDLAERNLNSIQLEPNSESRISQELTLLSSPRSTVGMPPVSLTKIHEQDRRSYGDEFLNTAEEVDDKHKETNLLETKEVGICSPRNKQAETDILRLETDAVNTIPGPGNKGGSADSLSCKLEELRPGLAVEADSECNVGTSTDHFRELFRMKPNQKSVMAEESAYEDSSLEKYGSLIKSESSLSSKGRSYADLALDSEKDNTNNRMTQTDFHLLGIQSLDSVGRGEVSKIVVSEPPEPPDEGKDCIGQASQRGKAASIGVLPNNNMNSPNQRKRKHHVLSDAEGGGIISKERDKSHESVESSNSREIFSTGKRALSFDTKISVGSKKFKKQSNENSCSGSFLKQDNSSRSFVRQGSSFMNWILNMGFSRSDEATTSLAIDQQPSCKRKVNIGSLPTLPDKNKVNACKTTGFHSIFQAMYLPRLRVQCSTPEGLDLQRETGKQSGHGTRNIACNGLDATLLDAIPISSERISNGPKELQVAGELFDYGSHHRICDGENVTLHNKAPMSSERVNQGTCQVENYPSTALNISPTNLAIHEKAKYNIWENRYLSNMESPGSSGQNGSGSPSEGKRAGIFSSVRSSSSNLVNSNRIGFLQSFWVTRLSPKVSAPMPNPTQFNQGMNSATEKLANICSIVSPPSENDASFKENYNSEFHCHSSFEGQMGSANVKARDYSITPTDLCGSKMVDTDQKLKSKLNAILPSRRFKKSEAMASGFSKRLDALRHITSSKVFSEVTRATTTCLFCGKSGHSLRECSKLVESELADLLKNLDLYDGIYKSFCLCIRCFQLNHWAIACPYASSKTKHVNDEDFIVNSENCERPLNKSGTRSCSANHDGGRIVLWENKQEHHHLVSENEISQRGNSRVETKVAVHKHVGNDVGEAFAPTAKVLYSNPVEEDLGDSRVKMNQMTPSSRENESKGNQIIPLCILAATKLSDVPAGIFDTIRSLRLSRADVVRWMKSSISYFSLEGFFLRLRLGEGLGGTGYRVACINGASSKNCLSVSMGGYKCVVDCRFVSNHDFFEDELMAWWAEILKDGKPPSREELNKKLQERMKFGF